MLNTKIGICCDKCCQKCLKNCCKRKPYYKRRYEELLSEETDEYFDKKLRKIAKKKAKGVCSKYIDSIASNQISQDNEQTSNTSQPSQTSINVEDAWSEISQADFIHLSIREQCDENSVVNQIDGWCQ